jgi:hypothetical protein
MTPPRTARDRRRHVPPCPTYEAHGRSARALVTAYQGHNPVVHAFRWRHRCRTVASGQRAAPHPARILLGAGAPAPAVPCS